VSIEKWANTCFGHAKLGDARRVRRLVSMTADAARKPAGQVTKVFPCGARRQAAYDLLEHPCVTPTAVSDALFDATACAASEEMRVLIAVDGSSLNLTDSQGVKGFGHVGSIRQNARGMKVLSALALSCDGVPIGLADQVWWTRHERANRKQYRAASQRESVHWRTVVSNVARRFEQHAATTKAHFLFDREGDATPLLLDVMSTGHEFTCRVNPTRKVSVDGRRCDVRSQLLRNGPIATTRLALPATASRRARVATLDIWAANLPMVMRNRYTKFRRTVPLTVVWVRERGRPPSRGGLNWFLYTNVPVRSASDARAVASRYTLRWRIEEFHKAWKSGLCRVEDSQLRSTPAVIKWATILAAVATRAERLRLRSRVAGDEPASIEFSDDELFALATLRSEYRPRETISVDDLTLATAVRWIADLGGYVGGKRSGPPGAITIARGLEPLTIATALIAKLRASGQLR
jgi:hypothetical protein